MEWDPQPELAFRFGCRLHPGDELLSAARQHVKAEQHAKAVELFTEALGKMPAEREAETRRVRVERAKSLLLAQQLPKAYDELALLVPELQNDPKADPAVLADAQVRLDEYELLRVVAALLDCPMPVLDV